jgi:2-amino-4-hydroxy-6-hydroxymethyldihydropteridine diphosphokinase
MEVLQITQAIEKDLGRIQKSVHGNYSDRSMDIDILLYDDIILHTDQLTIPHPLMCERKFVLEPLVEIAPELIHPITGKTFKEYL